MEKEFDKWNKIKGELDTWDIPSGMTFKERDIWMCFVGVNVGAEQDGQGAQFLRPVLVFRIFNAEMFWGIPTTTKPHDSLKYYRFNLGGTDQFAILNQIRLFSTKRFQRFVTVLPDALFADLLISFKSILPENEIPLSGAVADGIPSGGEFTDR